jgi:antitoxin (DNA-binding transcriptional repressor) of toxin-antitoxin stability system
VPAGEIDRTVRELAAEIAANTPLTLRATKEMIRRVLAKRRLAPGADADMVEMCYTSADFREGVTAFLAKRRARLDAVKRTGQPLLITRRGEPIAEVTPPSPPRASSAWLGSLRSTGRIVGDIVSPATAAKDWGALGS